MFYSIFEICVQYKDENKEECITENVEVKNEEHNEEGHDEENCPICNGEEEIIESAKETAQRLLNS